MQIATRDAPSGKANLDFRGLSAGLDYPLYILTTMFRSEPTGCLIGFATQCSIHPPRFLACLSKQNHTFKLAEEASAVAVHILDEGNHPLARLFGGETGDEVDKFSRVRWHLEGGVPVLDDCARWFTATVLEQVDFGDHVGHLLEPREIQTAPATAQLTYQQARKIQPGHEP